MKWQQFNKQAYQTLGSLCREPPKLALLTLGNPGNEGAPALAGGGEIVRKSYFCFKTLPPARGLATSPYANPKNSTALVSGNPVHKGGLGCAAILNVGLLACSRRFAGKGYFTFEKSQILLRRSLRAKALGFVRFAMLHYQNFVSGVALAQDDVWTWSLHFAFSGRAQRAPTQVRAYPWWCDGYKPRLPLTRGLPR